MTNPAIDLLLRRRSVSANALGEPGPTQSELELILRAASRVPDHKKLVPWRFILFQGEARADFGKVLARPAGPKRRNRAHSGSRPKRNGSCARRS
jgi:nitroreductase